MDGTIRSDAGRESNGSEAAGTGEPRGPSFVVGVGASAGGLEALEVLFDGLRPDTGMAFVVVQHLSPDFKSMMDELLSRHTRMPIYRVADGMQVEANSVYLIPPKKEMIISGGKLLLTDKDPGDGLSLPIDTFLRSLAQDAGKKSIAVILSGSGSDGSRGVKAVHEAGGLVIVQTEDSAKFDSMPKSAAETGAVDLTLAPSQIGEAISKYAVNPSNPVVDEPEVDSSDLEDIFKLLRVEYGIDFSWYKMSTVGRRIERRVHILQAANLADYVARLREDRGELNNLYKDLLIGVTKFFRDPAAFDRMAVEVIPQVLSSIKPGEEARLWVAGCATGEEAYSLAILIQEQLIRIGRHIAVKIFATDVHQASLDHASAGLYDAQALSELSEDRLEKYFVRVGRGYQVSRDLRKMIVFAPHNLIRDAPFTRIDLISCRNMLIYLQQAAQQKVISLFHFALCANGILFLGPSEGPADLADEFEPIDRHWKIYRKRRDVRLSKELRLPPAANYSDLRAIGSVRPYVERTRVDDYLLPAYETLVKDHAPPTFLLDAQHRLLHTFSGGSQYLRREDGIESPNLLDRVADDLRVTLTGALQRAQREGVEVALSGIDVRRGEMREQANIRVRPFRDLTDSQQFLVSVEPVATSDTDLVATEGVNADEAVVQRMLLLETELRHTKENLQATIEELETSNEELQATNEELVASNEELQSTNEELHSVNEELYTVNAEHQRKIEELTEMSDDMDNLFRSTEVGTVFLDDDLRIRKVTPTATRIFQILPQDTGRPFESFNHSLMYSGLHGDVRSVAAGGPSSIQKEVRDRDGVWYLLRILRYHSRKDTGGVLVSIVDIDLLKHAQQELGIAYDALSSTINGVVIAEFDWTLQYANPAFAKMFELEQDPVELIGKPLSSIFVPENIKRIAEICAPSDEAIPEVMEYTIVRRDGSSFNVEVASSVVSDTLGNPRGRMVSFINITKRKKAEETRESYAAELEMANETLRVAEEEARIAIDKRDQFLAMLSHELRNPLSGVLNAVGLLNREEVSVESASKAKRVIERQAKQMARLLADLLDVGRVTRGKIDFRKQVFDVREIIDDAVQAVSASIESKGQSLDASTPEAPVPIDGDPTRIIQVIENLLTNASRYTPSGGRIDLSLESVGPSCTITVTDNGKGIAPSVLPHVFDLFVQGETTLDRTDGGIGVGLTLVKSLVELHGGVVQAHSEGVGKGSRFVVEIPLSSRTIIEPAKSPEAGATRGLSIVVVEDNADVREMMVESLELDGHRVVAAPSGDEGLAAIESALPDIALIDIGLPGIDGYEVAERVRQGKAKETRLVALTGYGRDQDKRRVREAGFDHHLVKPITDSDLARVLSKA